MADLSITATEVLYISGQKVTYNAGETITAGQVVYKSSNTLKLADADSTLALATVVGIALNGGATGQPIACQTSGTITIGATAAMTQGEIYLLSATAGGIAPEGDIATEDDYVVVLGVANDSDQIVLNIHNSGVQIPAA